MSLPPAALRAAGVVAGFALVLIGIVRLADRPRPFFQAPGTYTKVRPAAANLETFLTPRIPPQTQNTTLFFVQSLFWTTAGNFRGCQGGAAAAAGSAGIVRGHPQDADCFDGGPRRRLRWEHVGTRRG